MTKTGLATKTLFVVVPRHTRLESEVGDLIGPIRYEPQVIRTKDLTALTEMIHRTHGFAPFLEGIAEEAREAEARFVIFSQDE